MLQVFRRTRPLAIVLLLLLAAILRLDSFFVPMVWESKAQGLVGDYLSAYLQHQDHAWVALLSCLVLVVQALWLASIVNRHRMTRESSLLPALIFVIIGSMGNALSAFSLAGLSLFFVLAAFESMLHWERKSDVYGALFNAGFFLAAGSLIYFPLLFFIFWAIMGLLLTQRFQLREWFILLLGVFTPLFLVFTWLFWQDEVPLFWKYYALADYSLPDWSVWLPTQFSTLLLLLTWGILLLISIFSYNTASNRALVKTAKQLRIGWGCFFIYPLSLLMPAAQQLSHLWMIAPMIALILGVAAYQSQRIWVWEAITLTLLLLAIALQYQRLLA